MKPKAVQNHLIHQFICCVRFALALAAALFVGADGRAQTQPVYVTVLHNFADADGANPYEPLVAGAGYTLYGVTPYGGTNTVAGLGVGTLFKIHVDGGGYSVVRNFSLADANPFLWFNPPFQVGPTVIQGSDGALYGTTTGGTNSDPSVFKMNADGTGYTVYEITNSSEFASSLMQGRDGNIYVGGFSTVLKLDPSLSSLVRLHALNTTNDGAWLVGKMIQGSDGALYETCLDGSTNGSGSVFKLNTDGSGFAVLHSFPDFAGDGANPFGGVIEGSDGALYGTTSAGGTHGAGTIFKMNLDGTGYQVLHNFQTNGLDGENPYGALVEGMDNRFYGTTQNGGTNNDGTIFEIGLNGAGYQVLFNFNGANGKNPWASLVPATTSDGVQVLYGATEAGGSHGVGALFGILVNPPLTVLPTVGQSASQTTVIWPTWALNYQLEMTTNLADTNSWTIDTNYIPATAAIVTNSQPQVFYRLVLPQ